MEITPANLSVGLVATKGLQMVLGEGGRGMVWKEQYRDGGGWALSSGPRGGLRTHSGPH